MNIKNQTPGTDDLIAQARELLKLDEDRTPGEWNTYDGSVAQNLHLKQFTHVGADEHVASTEIAADAAFIAAAPRMASLLRQLAERLEAAESDATRYRYLRDHALNEGRLCFFVDADHTVSFDSSIHFNAHLDSAIDAAMKESDR